MMSASWPRSRKYSPIVHPEYGAMYCIAADSDAVATRTMVYFHRAVLLDLANHVLDRRRLLSDRNVDADELLALLIDDRIDGNRGLAGLAIADDELTLTAP